jgi:ferrous iron transport protein A
MTLSDVKKGQKLRIIKIENSTARHQTIRLGLGEGSKVLCSEKLPYGPVLVKLGFQEVAIGKSLADKITISLLEVKHA